MFVRTDRLLLRPGWREDAAALAQAINDPAVLRNLARVPTPYGIEDAAAFLDQPQDDACPDFLIFRRTFGAPELIGGVGLARLGHDVELGYWIARRHWGLGYASEAAAAVVRIAEAHRVGRLVSGHFTDNPASGNVLRKLGFRPSGLIVPRFSMARGGDVPCALFERVSAAHEEPQPLAA